MSIMTKKRQTLIQGFVFPGTKTYSGSGALAGISAGSSTAYMKTDVVIGGYHLVPRKPHKGKPYKGKHPHKRKKAKVTQRKVLNSGGAVDIMHSAVYPFYQNVDVKRFLAGPNGSYQTYQGPLVYGFVRSASIPAAPGSISELTLSGMGALGWEKFKPTAQRGQLGQTLGELHDLPTLPKLFELQRGVLRMVKVKSLRKAGKLSASEYLNYQFGWVPLVSDLLDLIKNIQNFNKNLMQLERDNGRGVRRGGLVSKSESTSTTTSSLTATQAVGTMIGPANLVSSMIKSPVTLTVTTSIATDYRFSGRFRYYIDFAKAHQGSFPEAARITRILLGVEIDPYVIWQLTPWSWLFEWFTNGVGASINNLVNDHSDNLVADYAYVNGKVFQNVQTRMTCTVDFGHGPIENFSIGQDVQTTFFRRRAASPYGFGVSWDNLSPKQLAILGALGITRVT